MDRRPEALDAGRDLPAVLDRRASRRGCSRPKVYDAVTVALKPEADPDGTRPVLVAVADRRKRTLEFGAGYSTSEGYDIDTRWSYFNKCSGAATP